MADGLVQVAPDSTGKKVDTSELTVGANTVERQRVVLADSSNAAGLAVVSSPNTDADAGDTALATEAYLKAWNGSSWDRVRMFTTSGVQIAPAPAPTATTGAITTASTTIGPVTMGAYDGLSVVVSGTYAGVNFGFWGSNDNAVWFPVAAVRTDSGLAETTTGVLTANTTRAWDVSIGEANYFRVVSTAFTSGSAAINILQGMFAAEPMVAAMAQGPAAAGAVTTGNPVLCGGSDGTNIRTLLTSTSGVLDAQITGATGTAMLPAAATAADALTNPTVTNIGATGLLFNGTSWDRARGMSLGSTTTGDTGAKTATGNGATQTNVGNKGVNIVIVLGTVSGTTPTCVFKVQKSVDGGTNWVDVPGATTASLTATGTYGISIYPGQAVTAGTTTSGTEATASAVLSRTWRMVWTIGGTTPSFAITSISYTYPPN